MALSLRVWHVAGSEQCSHALSCLCEPEGWSGRSSSCVDGPQHGAGFVPTTLSQPAQEMCQFYCPAGEITNLEKQLSFGRAEPSTLSSFPSKADYLT